MKRDRPTLFSILLIALLPLGVLVEAALGLPPEPTVVQLLGYSLAHTALAFLDNRELESDGAIDRRVWGWSFLLPVIYLWIRTREIGGNYAHIVLWVGALIAATALAARLQGA